MQMLWPIVTQALRTPRRIAVIDDQRQYSYAQLLGGAMFMAEQIESVSAKAHIGILLPTGGLFPMALLGAWLAKRVAVPLNYLLKPDELSYVIQDSGIDTVLTVGPLLKMVQKAAGPTAPIPESIHVVCMDELDFSGLPPLRWPPVAAHDDLAVILYTSGTSGRPKGVMLSQGNFRSNVDAAIEHAEITWVDTFLGVLPQFHSFGLTALTLIPLRVGAKVVYTARFVPKHIVRLLRRHRPHIFMAIPSMYAALLSVKSAGPDDFESIRMPISGGEPLPGATFEACLDKFSLRILEGYGLTETAPAANWCTPTRYRRRSVGPALPGVDIRIVDDEHQTLAANQDGEILIAGPNIMKGYYNLPKETAEVFIDLPAPGQPGDNGQPRRRYFRTGDIGHLDDDGFLYITGRKKEMLIIGGENVFPREIEEVLNRHETVRESAVIGRTDDVRGEVPIAFVEILADCEFDDGSLRAWCREHLAGYTDIQTRRRGAKRSDAVHRGGCDNFYGQRLVVGCPGAKCSVPQSGRFSPCPQKIVTPTEGLLPTWARYDLCTAI